MTAQAEKLGALVEEARRLGPIRVAVVDAAQGLVLETLRQAHERGIAEPMLVGDPEATRATAGEAG